MVDYLAEKVDKCPLNWGHKVYCLHAVGTAKTFHYTEQQGISYSRVA